MRIIYIYILINSPIECAREISSRDSRTVEMAGNPPKNNIHEIPRNKMITISDENSEILDQQ